MHIGGKELHVVSETEHIREILQLPSVTQIGIVVANLDELVAFYQEKLHFGRFERISDFQKLGYKETYYKGVPERFNAYYAFFRLGTMEIEVIQPLEGRSIHRDFLNSGRQGLHHLGFDVYGDFNERIEVYAKNGIQVLMSGRAPNRKFAYLDTEKVAGIIVELIDRGGPRKTLEPT
jgi:catechol 2,3-dioxygenase-like lactoylglutathione lyase family enzyme